MNVVLMRAVPPRPRRRAAWPRAPAAPGQYPHSISATIAAARTSIDPSWPRSIGPAWEANHVSLILTFVVLWTSFPEAYASITLTLSVPLMIAALGVLRGASFAFRTAVVTTRNRRLFGAGFATPERGGSISSTVEQIGRRRMRGSPARAAIHPTGVMPQPSDQR